MKLGDALMAAFGGEGDDYDSPRDAAAELVEHYGSVRAAARALDVPRRTLRGWLDGKNPRGGGGWLGDIAREFDRASRLNAHVAASVPRTPGSRGHMRGAEARTVPIGQYLDPGTVDRVRDLYLGGADAEDLARAFASGINDGGFYAHTFGPDSDAGFWDIEWIDLDEGEIFGGYDYE